MAEQNLNQGIELHSKAQALSVSFPLGSRGAATAFPPFVPSVFTNSPFYLTVLVFSCSPLSCARSANNKTTPEPQSPSDDPDGLPHIAWHVRTHSCVNRMELGYNAPCNLKSQALHHRDRHERKLGIARGLSIHVGFFFMSRADSRSVTNIKFIAITPVY
ncbi:hypothetical protein ALC57_02324 [Trachymyrmex cornetzi]|uniref:Uncharacterized protein n=1 Tax=Trachymyrmex cornetzi TaxID=471704 RepID=A0A195EJ33_9HYME|nr:hypothetical protein ALC57_02324 [Trachymyrmex cornetzi]